MPPKDPARAERKQMLQALVQSDVWRIVDAGLRAQRKRTMEAAMNPHATDRELREWQSRFEVLSILIERPVEYLAMYEDKGD
jgi:hypothetical protein